MKKGIISFLIVLVFIFSLYGNTEELAQSYDLYDGEVSTNPNRTLGGRQFTSEGQVKGIVIVIALEGVDEWTETPDYHFIEESIGTNWEDNSISKYFYDMSNGLLELTGETHYIIVPEAEHVNKTKNQIIDYCYNEVFPTIDNISDFDQWTFNVGSNYNHVNEPDGKIDYLWVDFISRFNQLFPSIGYTGCVGVPFWTNSSVYVDVNGSNILLNTGLGSQQSNCDSEAYTRGIMIHELLHLMMEYRGRGGHSGRLAELSNLNGNQVGWNRHEVAFNSYEKYRLGYLDFDEVIQSQQEYILSDYLSNNQALILNIPNSSKAYVFENRQYNDNPFDRAFDKGLYVYRIDHNERLHSYEMYENVSIPEPRDLSFDGSTDGDGYDGYIGLLSAKGRYDFDSNRPNDLIINSSDLRISKENPNQRGYDERDFVLGYKNGANSGISRAYCMYSEALPWYDESNYVGDANFSGPAFGSEGDAFSLSFNKVISPWSNPAIEPVWSENYQFACEIIDENNTTGEITLKFYFDNIELCSPSRPLALKVTESTYGLDVSFYHQQKPNHSHYELFMKQQNSDSWELIKSIYSTSSDYLKHITLNDNIPNGGNQVLGIPEYKIVSVDQNNKRSNSSDIFTATPLYVLSNDRTMRNLELCAGTTLRVLRNELTIDNNFALTFGESSKLVIYSDGVLNLNNHTQLVNGYDTCLIDNRPELICNGTINHNGEIIYNFDNTEQGLLITLSETSVDWQDIEINNCIILTTIADLNFNNIVFSDTPINIKEGNIVLENITTNSSITVNRSGYLIVNNSIFDGANAQLRLLESSFKVDNCNFENSANWGLWIENCEPSNLFERYYANSFNNCNINTNSQGGVRVFRSDMKLYNCLIENNLGHGVFVMGPSVLDIRKDSNNNTGGSSKITNNQGPEILNLGNCLNIVGGKNYIVDNTYNIDDWDEYLIFSYSDTQNNVYDVSKNFWGYSNNGIAWYPPSNRFDQQSTYIVSPVWDPATTPTDPPSDNDLFFLAVNSASSGQIEYAISMFKQIISDFPSSPYFKLSSQYLFALETDKNALKDYYLSEPQFNYDGQIDHTIEYLIKHCDIKLGNYQEAINWFENEIMNPRTEYDSLIAVIDLGYVYTLVNESKATVNSKLRGYIPNSSDDYYETVASLISNNFKISNNTNSQLNTVEPSECITNITCYPNPFNPTTTISFNLNKISKVDLSIYNLKGQKVKTITNEILSEGHHNYVWNGTNQKGNNVSSGVYFYKLIFNDSIYTKKLLMLK